MKTCHDSEGSRGTLRRPVDLIGRPVLTGGVWAAYGRRMGGVWAAYGRRPTVWLEN